MNRARFSVAILGASLFLLGCSDSEPLAPWLGVDITAHVVQTDGPEEIRGELHGALFAHFRPENWNGDLVVYAHGAVLPDEPIALPEALIDELRPELLDLGYAVAYSSYSKNGAAVEEGFRDTRVLPFLFAFHFRHPRNTYVVGRSLGGLVSVMLAEQEPRLFSGALPISGVIGGTQFVADHLITFRVLFDYFYPGVVSGTALEVPEGIEFNTEVAPAVIAAFQANPLAAFELVGVDQIDVPFQNTDELVQSMVVPLFFHFGFINDLVERTHGQSPFDNQHAVYTGSSDDEALNAGVARYRAGKFARRYLRRFYQPHGHLRIPVLTLHTTRDPIALLSHESEYERTVRAAGRSHLLVQRQFDRYGHTTITSDEVIAAFLDLVTWVESGVKPSQSTSTLVAAT